MDTITSTCCCYQGLNCDLAPTGLYWTTASRTATHHIADDDLEGYGLGRLDAAATAPTKDRLLVRADCRGHLSEWDPYIFARVGTIGDAVSHWTDPTVLIPAVSGLIGAAIGGLCSILASRYQVKRQFEQQKAERREAASHQFDGLRVLLQSAKAPAQCTEVAMALRRFFIENPEFLSKIENRNFFRDYLAELCGTNPPSDAYWTDLRILGFLTDEDQLKS
jgi:hypothetical protein